MDIILQYEHRVERRGLVGFRFRQEPDIFERVLKPASAGSSPGWIGII
jgi:hypothetical protein